MIGARRAVLLGSGRALRYLLRATFTTDIAAPLPASLPIDVGGPLTVVDTLAKMSISNGVLNLGTGTGLADPGIWGPPLSRVSGRAVVCRIAIAATGIVRRIGFDDTGSGDIRTSMYFAGGTEIRVYDHNTQIASLGTYAAATYDVVVILRASGSFILIKGGAFTNWTLLWVGVTDIGATVYPASIYQSALATNGGTLDNLRALDLAPLDARFATDYGLATNRLTSPAAGATTTSTADAVIEIVTNVMSASTSHIYLRKQDASNTWRISYNSGLFSLVEVVAGTPATRASDATANANGTRFVVVMEGNVIKGYSNNTLRWTYSSATNFQTATGVEVLTLNGSITELVCWPRTLSLPGGV